MFSPGSLFCLAERRSDGLERKKGTQTWAEICGDCRAAG
jgi:hypothetical protein